MATRVGMVSLGCPKNQVDAEKMLYSLKSEGYEIIQDAALAEFVVINTCGFIETAKQEAIETILEFATLKNEGRIKGIIVTGCLAERYREEIIEEIPEIDAVVGLGSNSKLADVIREVARGKKIQAFGKKEELSIEGKRIITTEPFYAYLKIAEGCDNCCTYCAIPSIRGGFRSRTMESIIEEANWLASVGVKEVVLVAQDTTRYGEDLYGESKLPELMKELCKIDGFKWIRTLYCYPERITDKLIQVLKEEEKLVKYLDIPIQHCNNQVLKRMNRKSDKESIVRVIEKLREEIPEIVLRTTLITGFPGETNEQFEELCEFVQDMRFDRLGSFAYSAEEGTPAAEFKDQVEMKIRERRAELVMDEQLRIMDELNESQIGKTFEVVTEGFDRYAECYFGRTSMDAPEIDGKIFFSLDSDCDAKPAIGQFVKVHIDDVLDYDLLGTRVE
ncbi:MAG: 30S ribosomal protein S12 methylthiotransferase RimO [Clostridiales bacterium]|nr:30S ribosomal protein S12 methylthiotransferase RimO [Clostridiales bacterium]